MKKVLSIIIVIAVCIFAIRSLFVPGFFTMHDDQQIARLYDLNNTVIAGEIPPRWVSHLGFGYGYPLFNFYPPFVYYAGELFYLIGFSLINATKIVMALGFILSAVFMYLWVKNRYGKLAGIVAAALYTYAPYHGVDLYVRGAFAEFFSFVWIPAIFWAFDISIKKKSYGWGMATGIFMAFLVLTHNLTALAFLPFLAGYAGLLLYEYKKDARKVFLIMLVSGFVALGLSAYFWIPSLMEKKYTLVDKILTRELADYTIHFVYPQQLWNSPWGYGGSIAGPNDGLSFQIGKIHILIALLALCSIIFLLLKRKKTVFPLVIFCLFLFSVFMTLTYSEGIWKIIQPLSYIQFPWRFLVFSVAFVSFLGGFLFSLLQRYVHRNVVYGISIVIIAATIILIAKFFHPAKYLDVTDSFYTTNHDIEWRVSNMSYEYAPNGIKTVLLNGTTHLPITQQTIPLQPYQALGKNMQVSVVINKPQEKEFLVKTTDDGLLVVNTFSFPGWQTFLDGKKIAYSDNNQLKLIVVAVPKGSHSVRLYFGDTVARTIGNILSGITMLSIAIFAVFSFRNIFKKK